MFEVKVLKKSGIEARFNQYLQNIRSKTLRAIEERYTWCMVKSWCISLKKTDGGGKLSLSS